MDIDVERDQEDYRDDRWWQQQDEEHQMYVEDCAERARDMNDGNKSIW